MTDAVVIDVAQKALMLTLALSAPLLGLGLIVGLIVSVFQAATQIHEMTLTFIPKIAAVGVALIVCGPWMLNRIVSFTNQLLQSIPSLVK
jgi:flagellar biosynthetic protein FliQ